MEFKAPAWLSVRELYDLAEKHGWINGYELPVEPISEARLPGRNHVEAILAMSDVDKIPIEDKEAKKVTDGLYKEIAKLQRELNTLWESGFNPDALQKSMSLSDEIKQIEQRIEDATSVKSIILEAIMDEYGELHYDYRTEAVRWRQEVSATKKKFGVEELVLFPTDVYKEHLPDNAEEGMVAVCVELEEQMTIMGYLPVSGAGSTFYRLVANMVDKPNTNNGIGNVHLWGKDIEEVEFVLNEIPA